MTDQGIGGPPYHRLSRIYVKILNGLWLAGEIGSTIIPLSLTQSFRQDDDFQLESLQLSRQMLLLPPCAQRPLDKHESAP
jgi:hypothetical protein